MNANVTFGKYVKGFEEWYQMNFNEVQAEFTPEAKDLFDTIEDFAVEIYFQMRLTSGSMVV
jgi:hypothetical protein